MGLLTSLLLGKYKSTTLYSIKRNCMPLLISSPFNIQFGSTWKRHISKLSGKNVHLLKYLSWSPNKDWTRLRVRPQFTEKSNHVQLIWSRKVGHYLEHESDISFIVKTPRPTTKAFYQDCSKMLQLNGVFQNLLLSNAAFNSWMAF